MRVLVGTPCGGGMVTNAYLMSMMTTMQEVFKHRMGTQQALIKQNPGYNENDPNHVAQLSGAISQHSYDLNLYTLAGESLIQRGRNHIAQVALSGGYDKLMFIDADAGWQWDQLKRILDNPAPVVAGLCPLKVYPITLNYLPFEEDEVHFKDGIRTLEGTKAMAQKHGSPLVKVPFVGTAFLCISRKVLMDLIENSDHYMYPNPSTGQPVSHWDIFKVQSIHGTYLSEDWGFCHKAREAGHDVLIDTEVIISHTGNHTFRV